ncbi:hypothetical protein Esti_000750 [Eimeria stiedai]
MSRTEWRAVAFPSHSEVGRREDGHRDKKKKPNSGTHTDALQRCLQVALFIALLKVKFWSGVFGERRSRLLVHIPSIIGKKTLQELHEASSAFSVTLETPREELLEAGEKGLPSAKLGKGFLHSAANVTEARGVDEAGATKKGTLSDATLPRRIAEGGILSEPGQKPTKKARLGSWADRGRDLRPLLHESALVMVDDKSKDASSLEDVSIVVALAHALLVVKLFAKVHREGKEKVQQTSSSTTPTLPRESRTHTQHWSISKPYTEEFFDTTDGHLSSLLSDVVEGPLWRSREAPEVGLALIPEVVQGTGLPAIGGFLEQLIDPSSLDLVLPLNEPEVESQTGGSSTTKSAKSRRRKRSRVHLKDKSAQVTLLLALLGVHLFTDFANGKTHPLLKHAPAFFKKSLANLPGPVANAVRYATGMTPPKDDLRLPRKKRTLPSGSSAKHKPKSSRKSSHKERTLPSVDEVDSRLSLSAEKGKRFLAQNVSLEPDARRRLSAVEAQVVAAVASVLTGDSGEDLMGQVIEVENVNSLQGPRTDTPKSRFLKIRKFLGKGSSWAAFKVEDVDTDEELGLRIFVMQKLQLPTDETIQLGKEAIDLEERSARQACGLTDPLLVGGEKGIAVPSHTAELAGIPEVSSTGRFHIFSRVQLMELMEEDLGNLLERQKRVPPETKEYIAQRLLLQVLHLQQAHVCHADLKLENCLMRKDGSFLLGDFGYSTPWGESMHNLSRLTLAYAEPELVLDFRGFLLEDEQVTPHPTSDLWSLGAVLFELFTDGDLPYGMMDVHNDLNGMCDLAKSLLDRDASSKELTLTLQEANVPQRWCELLLRLLEPQRAKRITGSEIVEMFPDLSGEVTCINSMLSRVQLMCGSDVRVAALWRPG